MNRFPSREETERLIAARVAAMVVCRMVDPRNRPAPPGTKAGYRCAICRAALEATPQGQAVIAGGGLSLCGPCGVPLAERIAAEGRLGAVATTETADANIDRGAPLGSRIDRLRKAYPYEGEEALKR